MKKRSARERSGKATSQRQALFVSFFLSLSLTHLPSLPLVPPPSNQNQPDKMFKKSKEREDEAKRNVSALFLGKERGGGREGEGGDGDEAVSESD